MVDAEELARLLERTALGDRAVEATDAVTLAVRCPPEEVWPAWRAARSVVAQTGRWPVVLTAWDDREPWGNEGAENRAAAAAGAVVAAADAVDPWTTFVHWGDAEPATWEYPLQYLVGRADSVLTEADARDLVAAGATFTDVERLRLDRRIAAATVQPARIPVSAWLTDQDKLWFVPTDQPCAVLFLPTDRTWESAAHLSYFGALEPAQQAALVAAERQWHERYGAELVASWDTMLQFAVTRRPDTVDDAWELAGQQLAVGGSLQTDRSDLALALLQTDYWFLHDRP